MKCFKQIHAQLALNNLINDTLTVASAISFCSLSKSGDITYACRLFDRVESPNKFMYNSLIRAYSNTHDRRIEALVLNKKMLCYGLLPNNFTFPFILKACAAEFASKDAILNHGLIVKLGYESNVFVMNALLHAYCSFGLINVAHDLFDEILNRNVVTWNSIIDGYSQIGDCIKVYGLFKMMMDSGLVPDGFTLVSLLSSCLQTKNLKFGKFIHHFIIVSGIYVDLIVGNALINTYGKCGNLCMAQMCFDKMPTRNVITWTSLVCAHAKNGQVDLSRSLFDKMPERNIASWNAMISCYIQNGQYHEGLDLYKRMRNLNVTPDETALVNAISACSQTGNLVYGKKVHQYICGNFVNPGISISNSILDMYAKCGQLDIALAYFNNMEKKNLVSWNIVIGAVAMYGHGLDAVKYFNCLVNKGFNPDGITFVGLLSACAHCGLLAYGKRYFEEMDQIYEVKYEIEHYACMVDLFGRGGKLQEAIQLIAGMPLTPDVVIWGAVLGACRIHGNVAIALLVMKHVLQIEPFSGGLFVLLSNIFCESGRWEDVKRLRKLMKEKNIKKEKGSSSIEMNGDVYEFVVDDMSHEDSDDIFIVLHKLTSQLMSSEFAFDDMGECLDEKE